MSAGNVPPRWHRPVLVTIVAVGGFLAVRYVLQLSPGLRPFSLRGLEGFCRYSVGDYGGAAVAYRAHLRDVFATGGLPVNDPEIALLQGDLVQARRLARHTLDRDPRSAVALLTLGEAALDEQATDEAVHALERVLAVAPEDVNARLLLGIAYARAGDQARAIRSVSLALRDWQPDRMTTLVRVLGELGRLYALPSRERPDCLLAHLHRYLRIYDGTHARLALARAADAIARSDHVDDAYVTAGVIHQKRADDAEALDAFLRAIDTNPRNAEAYRWAAVVYADRGDLANQYRMARAAYELDPDDPAYALPLGDILAKRLGDYHAALDVETKVLASGRETPAVLDMLGYLHGVLGHAEQSVEFYRREAALAPNDPGPLRGLSWPLFLEDRREEQIATLRRALVLAPSYTDAREQLAVAYRDAGRYDEAVSEFERVYREDPTRRVNLPTLCITYQLAARFQQASTCAAEFLSWAPWSPDMTFLRSFTLASALRGDGRP